MLIWVAVVVLVVVVVIVVAVVLVVVGSVKRLGLPKSYQCLLASPRGLHDSGFWKSAVTQGVWAVLSPSRDEKAYQN